MMALTDEQIQAQRAAARQEIIDALEMVTPTVRIDDLGYIADIALASAENIGRKPEGQDG